MFKAESPNPRSPQLQAQSPRPPQPAQFLGSGSNNDNRQIPSAALPIPSLPGDPKVL